MYPVRRGLSVLEVLVVISFLSILSALGHAGWSNLRASVAVDQMAQQAVQELNAARSDSRRVSEDQAVTWDASAFGDKELPSTVTVSPEEGKIIYTAPHGRTDMTEDVLELTFEGARGKTASVYVYGVTGKVSSQ